MNEVAKHRPRSTLILGSQLENQRIRDLENENRELHLALADHQSTLELIMNKYREQVRVLLKLLLLVSLHCVLECQIIGGGG